MLDVDKGNLNVNIIIIQCNNNVLNIINYKTNKIKCNQNICIRL